jgi:cystathionine beta-lyase
MRTGMLCGQAWDGQGAAAGLFSVVFDPAIPQAQVDALRQPAPVPLGYSWGGPMSLVVPYDLASMRQRPSTHVRPGMWCFSIGLEAEADLRADLAQALRSAFVQR